MAGEGAHCFGGGGLAPFAPPLATGLFLHHYIFVYSEKASSSSSLYLRLFRKGFIIFIIISSFIQKRLHHLHHYFFVYSEKASSSSSLYLRLIRKGGTTDRIAAKDIYHTRE